MPANSYRPPRHKQLPIMIANIEGDIRHLYGRIRWRGTKGPTPAQAEQMAQLKQELKRLREELAGQGDSEHADE